jgi:uncharacterized protein (DUF983 family)
MDLKRANKILLRGLKLRCPACGRGTLYETVFTIRDHCLACGYVFSREQGYFVGGLYINIAVTQLMIAVTYVASSVLMSAADERVYTLLFAVAAITPLAFYRHSKSLWLSLDYIVDPPRQSSL